MIAYENECVGCPKEMGCLGSSCPNRHVLHLICDECGSDVEELFEYDDKEVCEDCLHDHLRCRTLD